MGQDTSRTHCLNCNLDAEHAAKLSRLAERTHINKRTLARSLLASAIEASDPDPGNVVALLDGIDGAYGFPEGMRARVRRGLVQLEQFPRLGPELHSRWAALRFVLGP